MDNNMKNNYFIQDWLNVVTNSVKLLYPDINDKELDEFLCNIIDSNIKVPIARHNVTSIVCPLVITPS